MEARPAPQEEVGVPQAPLEGAPQAPLGEAPQAPPVAGLPAHQVPPPPGAAMAQTASPIPQLAAVEAMVVPFTPALMATLSCTAASLVRMGAASPQVCLLPSQPL